ncbi:sporulation protein YunB [Paenibacillus polysaccharolyticus]|uniref:sporulation protein YunB n=1 Tax=Paenibacillus polysaccharolyticus TaxID=582692 RepID=UPI0020A0B4BF|nr:sporulation protein YunB [Paenibacillus polysaccharolyticus]MCP1131989.1 sporulation protein YunB [Paenibacillus polysaccharolyticus]
MMRKRWRSRRRRSKPPSGKRKVWLIALLVAIFCLMQGFAYVDKKMKPPIMHLAKIRVKQIATEAINKAITAQVAEGKTTEGLIDWKTDTAGKVSGFMLNYNEHMRITASTMNVVQSTLQNVHMLKEKIPLGQALGSPVMASFGPSIPVRIEPQGAVKVDLNTRQQNAGINMILVEVYIHIIAEVAVVVPFDMEPETVDTEIPISYLLVVGDVPMYYYDNQGRPVGSNGSNAPAIALPSGQAGVSNGGNGHTGSGSGTNSGNGNGNGTRNSGEIPGNQPQIPNPQQAPGNNTQSNGLELELDPPDLNGSFQSGQNGH